MWRGATSPHETQNGHKSTCHRCYSSGRLALRCLMGNRAADTQDWAESDTVTSRRAVRHQDAAKPCVHWLVIHPTAGAGEQ